MAATDRRRPTPSKPIVARLGKDAAARRRPRRPAALVDVPARAPHGPMQLQRVQGGELVPVSGQLPVLRRRPAGLRRQGVRLRRVPVQPGEWAVRTRGRRRRAARRERHGRQEPAVPGVVLGVRVVRAQRAPGVAPVGCRRRRGDVEAAAVAAVPGGVVAEGGEAVRAVPSGQRRRRRRRGHLRRRAVPAPSGAAHGDHRRSPPQPRAPPQEPQEWRLLPPRHRHRRQPRGGAHPAPRARPRRPPWHGRRHAEHRRVVHHAPARRLPRAARGVRRGHVGYPTRGGGEAVRDVLPGVRARHDAARLRRGEHRPGAGRRPELDAPRRQLAGAGGRTDGVLRVPRDDGDLAGGGRLAGDCHRRFPDGEQSAAV
ncbi:hypothetical protein OsI_05108 [Oryza sativa Indica Group]|uniref:Uncharacterized protein n=1 Tax=Oryza sativa subsp. indica TaxID=39946 RepID=B8A8V2_ORYSI|nr:hypothetical protein OsI_05108 [Oryza sativa Indica Group]